MRLKNNLRGNLLIVRALLAILIVCFILFNQRFSGDVFEGQLAGTKPDDWDMCMVGVELDGKFYQRTEFEHYCTIDRVVGERYLIDRDWFLLTGTEDWDLPPFLSEEERKAANPVTRWLRDYRMTIHTTLWASFLTVLLAGYLLNRKEFQGVSE